MVGQRKGRSWGLQSWCYPWVIRWMMRSFYLVDSCPVFSPSADVNTSLQELSILCKKVSDEPIG